MAVGTPTIIEGRKVTVVNRRPPLQPSLDRLLAALYLVSVREDIRPSGASAQCERDREHRFGVLREGRHVGLDGLVRDLRVQMCRDCGAVCVRDISRDRLDGLPTGGRPLARKDHVIGWYSGARRNQRQYR